LGKEIMLRRLMLLLGFLAAMMLLASPVLAWQPGPGEGSKYWKNYYPPTTTYFKYCEPDGSQYYGDKKASNPKWCNTWYTDYQKTPKTFNGKKYYYVHVYYSWKTPDGRTHEWDDWYYCQFHKYNDPDSNHWYFRAWVTYKPTDNSYWESFYWQS
jgi:hypothetical protein